MSVLDPPKLTSSNSTSFGRGGGCTQTSVSSVTKTLIRGMRNGTLMTLPAGDERYRQDIAGYAGGGAPVGRARAQADGIGTRRRPQSHRNGRTSTRTLGRHLRADWRRVGGGWTRRAHYTDRAEIIAKGRYLFSIIEDNQYRL